MGWLPRLYLNNEYAKDLSFLQIYFGHVGKIPSPHAWRSTKTPWEVRCSDRRGVEPPDISYMALKMIRFNMIKTTIIFRTNNVTSPITHQQPESGDFMRDASE
ncbi:hypothetical protein MRX96_015244 [Rhipicephalus microplus]|uniref:Uncharacterized protein n=1 Tax=Rhipicephalus microplus TaxID=6941 RepID=A0A9J6DBJ0_RHIMP|nr:hypothetical protein HPB51_018818 [Rhipicephalus microplus]